MRSVGVRELKVNASRVLRELRDQRQPIDVTYRGRVIARLVPVDRSNATQEQIASVWADLDQLAAEIGNRWPTDVTATQAVREQRRDL